MAQQKDSTGAKPKKRQTTSRKRTTTATKQVATSPKSTKIRKEVRGLFIMLIALVGLIGIFGLSSGTFIDILSGFFIYGFGLGGIIPCLYVGYVGWRILYADDGFRVTRRGLLLTVFFLFLITLITLIRVPDGHELETTRLASEGGVVGGLLGSLLRNLLGEIGALVVDIVILLGLGLLITQLSLRTGLQRTKAKAEEGLVVARAATEEAVQTVRERYEDWKEEQVERRRVYDQEKDMSYTRRTVSDESEAVEEAKVAASSEGTIEAKAEVPNSSHEVSPEVHSVGTGLVAGSSMAVANAHESQAAMEEPSMSVIDTQEPHPAVNGQMDAEGAAVDASTVLSDGNSWRTMTENSTFDDSALHVAGDANYHGASATAYEADATVSVSDDIGLGSEAVRAPETMAAPAFLEPHMAESMRHNDTASMGDATFAEDDQALEKAAQVPSLEDTEKDRAAVAVNLSGDVPAPVVTIPYHYPPLTMLAKGTVSTVLPEEIQQNIVKLEQVLKDFKVDARVINATQGPTVTRYELEPAAGIKVSKIVGLKDEITLGLAASHSIRIEAPIPGKSAVGIEIPNKQTSAVYLRDVLESNDFQQAKGGIPVGLGKDIAGKPVITDLSKMPHLLVAGATGSGKSVCVNTLISSILFSRKPTEVKLILVDPKMVELSMYNGIPHLMAPVVTDMKKAANVLRWLVREMDARYKILDAARQRKITGYNAAHPDTALPYIVAIIDEMADLMMQEPEVEEQISRLAAKARAAGIHLVLATQRPSVDVITGVIKSNVPSRISFAVASAVDSRTILDAGGAENLVGKGDMLFSPIGANKPTRIQGAFISDEEVENLVEFVKKQGQPSYDERVIAASSEENNEDQSLGSSEEYDELLPRAIDLVFEHKQASASYIQRRLRVGFSRGARLIDTMEDMKIVGPSNSSKSREILMTREEVHEKYGM
ncbi:DNA translocase FtsK [uncultured Veillonella sp.]|uniref:DNA translocase FtsK n=1 Tax=uncultured Veillonella sp. TaxID=159268 RepID=UPI002610EC31|nr:DNA translocase FtsK 4TM domain-containing protein [uncultured Veillonella sp.]